MSPSTASVSNQTSRTPSPVALASSETRRTFRELKELVLAGGIVEAVKTFYTTEIRQIVRQAHQLGWLLQLAHYTRGALEHFGLLERFQHGQVGIEWWTILCEEEAPHDCSAVRWTQAEQGRAQAQLSVMLQTLQSCRETDQWPGRGEVQAQQDNVNEQEG